MRRAFFALTTAVGLVVPALPLAAQNVPVETRVDRLEKEMRAVQRKVFPAGTPVQPDISATPAAPVTAPSASTPVSDLIARVNALETQVATLTGQVEQNNFKLRQLEDGFAKYKADIDARLNTAASATAVPASIAASPSKSPAAQAPAPSSASKPPKAVTTPAGEARKSAVAAIEQPSTGNAADDAYTYGYRLWEAKFLPEAQVQLKTTVEKYGSGSVGSRAQNLLGRAYLDDGKPALASVAFYENYQKRPRGDRAADSLAYLGDALIQLKKPADACKVYEELETAYGSTLSAKLRGMMEKGRVRAKCTA